MSFYIDSQLLEAFKNEVAAMDFGESVFTVAHAEMWVRVAIADHIIAARIYDLCSQSLHDPIVSDDATLLRQALALHYIRALGARHLLPLVLKALDTQYYPENHRKSRWFFTINPLSQMSTEQSAWSDHMQTVEQSRDGQSMFTPLITVYSARTMGETALHLITYLALNSDPIKAQVFEIVKSHLDELSYAPSESREREKLLDWLWDNWQVDHQESGLLNIVEKCVENRNDRLETLAIRLALITTDLAEQVCQQLAQLPMEQKQFFSQNLEKQLKRVGKVKLWVYCRNALFAT